jgi:phosphate transport system permease protein
MVVAAVLLLFGIIAYFLFFDNNRNRSQRIAFGMFNLLALVTSGLVFFLLGFIFFKGIGVMSWEFLTQPPREGMMKGGIFPAIIGTFLLVLGACSFSFPVGILAGIFMSEYTKENFFKRFISMMTNNLAGIPSVVFGLFGLSLFVNILGFGMSVLSGSLTLGLMVLPVVVRTTEESLKSVEYSNRLASYALGASKWTTIWRVVLPAALPSIMTGLIISIGRVAGETAPIIFTAAAFFLPVIQFSLFEPVMALPYHLYVIATSGTDREVSLGIAYGTALTLVMLILILNILANVLRNYFSRNLKKR